MELTTPGMPAHEDSEIALLAACVLEPSLVNHLAAEAHESLFTGERRAIRRLLLTLIPAHGKSSHAQLEAEWKARNLPTDGLRQISLMRTCDVAGEHWSWHLERVKSAAMRRNVLKRAESVFHAAGNGSTDESILAEVESLGRVGTEHATSAELVTFGEDLTPLVRSERWAERRSIVDLRMGRRFEGVRGGEVFTLLARTWVGKSAWASQAVLNSKAHALIVSLEMPKVQWWERTAMQLFGVGRHEAVDAISYGRMTPGQAATLAEAEKRIAVADTCDGGFPSMQAAVTRCESRWKKPPALIVIDYLQLLRSPVMGTSRYDRVTECALEVKRFAKRNRAAVILLCQVGRQQGADGSMEIGLESARDSGQIEEAADFMLGLWRPGHAKGLSNEDRERLSSEMKGRLLKNRRGGSFPWNFNFETHRLRITPEEGLCS
jgi:replicative DNA helicase